MENILIKTKKFALDTLNTKLDPNLVYHNLKHTLNVVKAVGQIAESENLSNEERFIIEIAAWLHDIGHINGPENHEEEGVKIARAFLKEDLSEEQLSLIEELILATKIGAQPQNLLQKIIRDADCSHLSKKTYFDYCNLIREELAYLGKTFDDLEWNEMNVDFFKKHQFYTLYALENWLPRKEKHLATLLNKIDTIKTIKEKESKKKKKENTPDRGIETMFRVSLKNHISLSSIADTKANILLSVNAIILSLALSSILPKLDNIHNSHLILPTITLMIVCLVTMVLAIMATRPNVTEGKFTRKDIEEKKVNLLFFGNFHQVPLNEYRWAMGELMKDKEYLYDSMIKDLYFLGLVLHKKYKILRFTYLIFTIGLIITVIAYILAFSFRETTVVG